MSTYYQLLYHVVFSTKNRAPLLADPVLRRDIFRYMAAICRNLGGFCHEANGWVEHGHLLVNIPPKLAVAGFVGQVKANASKHLNDHHFARRQFRWQDGYSAFSVSPWDQEVVARYIRNQEAHHQKQSFETELAELIARYEAKSEG